MQGQHRYVPVKSFSGQHRFQHRAWVMAIAELSATGTCWHPSVTPATSKTQARAPEASKPERAWRQHLETRDRGRTGRSRAAMKHDCGARLQGAALGRRRDGGLPSGPRTLWFCWHAASGSPRHVPSDRQECGPRTRRPQGRFSGPEASRPAACSPRSGSAWQAGRVDRTPLLPSVAPEAPRASSTCSRQAHGCLELIGKLLAGLSLTSTSREGTPSP